MKQILVMMILVWGFAGCAHVISPEVRQEVDTDITFRELQQEPEAFQGKTVLLGGVIVATENREDGTLMEVYQTQLDMMGEPTELDTSGGRFLAFYAGFLDAEIYSKGRKVTVAGVVQGTRVRDLGQLSYRYPYLTVREIHLWEKEREYPYPPHGRYGYPWWTPYYGPYSPYAPYWY